MCGLERATELRRAHALLQHEVELERTKCAEATRQVQSLRAIAAAATAGTLREALEVMTDRAHATESALTAAITNSLQADTVRSQSVDRELQPASAELSAELSTANASLFVLRAGKEAAEATASEVLTECEHNCEQL